jgi:hypothetical protein
MSVENIERFARRIIDYHGFRSNESFYCLIPDNESFSQNDGLSLWVYSKNRHRFETRIEKFHNLTRIKRMEKMIGVSEEEFSNISLLIEEYLDSLKDIGFVKIGKGVKLFGKGKIYNVQAEVSVFDNNLEALKAFEKVTINNPIVDFAEEHGYFEVRNRNTLVWNELFGSTTKKQTRAGAKAKPESKAKAKPESKAKAKPESKAKAKPESKAKAVPESKAKAKPESKAKAVPESKAKAKPESKAKAVPESKAKAKPEASHLVAATPFSNKLKALATQKPVSMPDWERKRDVWKKQVGNIYRKIETWLSEHVKNGYMSFNEHGKVTLSDPIGGDYEVETLELDIVGGHQVVFQPVEMNILGTVGRMDLQHRGDTSHKVMLLLIDRGKSRFTWELWKGINENRQPFKKETLEAVLNQWT